MKKAAMLLNTMAMLLGRYQLFFTTVWPFSATVLLSSKIKLNFFTVIHLYYFIICFISFMFVLITAEYSQDIFYPVKCLISIFLSFLSGAMLVRTQKDQSVFVDTIAISCIVLFILSLIGIDPFNEQWIGGAYNGFFANRNGCAFFLTLIACYYLGSFTELGKKRDLLFFLLLSAIVLFTLSRIGFGLITIMFVYLTLHIIRKNPFLYLPIILLIFLIAVRMLGSSLFEHRMFVQMILLLSGEGHNVSERFAVYQYAINLLANVPIYGYGFYKFGDLSPYLQTHAHNIFLQGFVDLGVLFLPIFLGYTYLFLNALRCLLVNKACARSLVFISYIIFSLVTLPIATPTSALILGLLYRKG